MKDNNQAGLVNSTLVMAASVIHYTLDSSYSNMSLELFDIWEKIMLEIFMRKNCDKKFSS